MKEGWEVRKLGHVCEKTTNIKWQDFPKEEFEYIDLSSVSRETLRITETSTINKENAPSRAKKIVQDGDVIFATTRPTLKRVTIIDENLSEQICSTGFCVLRPNKSVLSSYIFYFILTPSFMNMMERLQRGASYPAVTDGDVKSTEIPIPPLPEQKQIVAIIDKAFAAIEQAQANLEKNIENAKELFQSKLNEIFSQKGDSWEEKNLDEVCEKTKNIKWQDFTTEEFEYVDLSSVSRETLSVTETTTVNKENAPSRAKKIIQNGDVIFATTRPTLRRATIIDEELSGNICSTGFVVLRPKQYLSSEWIFFYLLTSNFMRRMESLQRGASYPAVTDSDVKGSTLSVPISKEIEKKNIQIMNEIQEYSNNLISHYQQKLTNLEDLKKSILQKAFSGELTSPEGTLYDKEVRSASEKVNQKSPERAI